ncbi:MAG: cupin domain-containing protein [Rhizobiaceae bacterium]|nr:cupin domain-containing protein [Rhizobiaceae bacterium]MCV0407814.1 cupin domain-containing protein [Rhizobiaceae bacterium]
MTIVRAGDWLSDIEAFRGEWQGQSTGSQLSLIADRLDQPGGGPRLHCHPYAEVFVVLAGTGLFTVEDRAILAGKGEIVVVPAGVAHKFTNPGPAPFAKISIHEAGSFSTEWLE